MVTPSPPKPRQPMIRDNSAALHRFQSVALSQRYGQSPTSRHSRMPSTGSSTSRHSLETVLLLMPDNPIAFNRPSTHRVQTPSPQGSWDDGHQPVLRRPSRLEKRRKMRALPQVRHPQTQRAKPGLGTAVATADLSHGHLRSLDSPPPTRTLPNPIGVAPGPNRCT